MHQKLQLTLFARRFWAFFERGWPSGPRAVVEEVATQEGPASMASLLSVRADLEANSAESSCSTRGAEFSGLAPTISSVMEPLDAVVDNLVMNMPKPTFVVEISHGR